MQPPLDAKAVANFFLKCAEDSGQSLDPMKLQKLVYYANGWYAGYTGTPLINESVEAWQYGPVVPSLYQEFKRYGAGPIQSKARSFDGVGNWYAVPEPTDQNIRQFLTTIWDKYSIYTGTRLSAMTHTKNSPWSEARCSANEIGIRSIDIPFDTIKEHFEAAKNTIKSEK